MTEEKLYDLADLFKMFGDSTRIRILMELVEGERNVSALSEKLSMTQSAVSHQLKVLKNGKLVKVKRQGQQMLYSLADDHVYSIILMGKEHIEEKDDVE